MSTWQVDMKIVRDVAERIQKVTGTNFALEIHDVPDINGWAGGEKIYVINVIKAAESLEEHEKAFLIVHEMTHNELRYCQKREQRVDEAVGKIECVVKETKGFVRKLASAVVGATEAIKVRSDDREQ